jgi:hypothetical protein
MVQTRRRIAVLAAGAMLLLALAAVPLSTAMPLSAPLNIKTEMGWGDAEVRSGAIGCPWEPGTSGRRINHLGRLKCRRRSTARPKPAVELFRARGLQPDICPFCMCCTAPFAIQPPRRRSGAVR